MTAIQLSTLIAQQSGGGLASLLPLVLLFGVLFFVMVLPQRRQRQRHEEFIRTLDVGADVVNSSGIYGRITHMEEDRKVAHVEVDTDVVLRMNTSALSSAGGDGEKETAGE